MVKPSLVYVPFYTCKASLEPFDRAKVAYKYYEIDASLDPKILPVLKGNEYFLFVNYFDLKRDTALKLSDKYGDKLIVDCAQAFFMKGNGKSWFFNSCRKFFGVPDGSYLYAPENVTFPPVSQKNEAYYFDHLLKRFNGYPAEGYTGFIQNELACGSDILSISKLSEYLLSNIEYQEVAIKRRSNFEYLHKVLGRYNMLRIMPDESNVPMCYPLVLQNELERELLYKKNIFIPAFWKDLLGCEPGKFEMEKSIAKRLLPLPIDHRYGSDDMERLVCTLKLMNNVLSLSKTT
jgi:hypothetical protein